MTNLTQNATPVQDPSDFFAECREAHQKKVEERKFEEEVRKAQRLEEERSRLLKMIEERLGIPRTELTIVEDKAEAQYGELTFFRREHRAAGYYDVDLKAYRPDPNSEDHILQSYDIKSREDLGAFLDGHVADRTLTAEAWERKEAQQEADYEPTPKHEKEADAPARPVFTTNQHGEMYIQNGDRGLTKREHFAAMAMQSLAAGDRAGGDFVAKRAVEYADELLKALHGESGGQES